MMYLGRLWAIQGLITGVSACGLAAPLLYLSGRDAMLFLIVAATSLSLVSMLTSYYLFGRFINGLSEELQLLRSPGDIPLSLRHMAHHLTPLCRVREARVLMKRIGETFSRTHSRLPSVLNSVRAGTGPYDSEWMLRSIPTQMEK